MCLSFSSNNTVWTDRLTIILVVKLQRSVIVIRAPNSCFSAEKYHKQNCQYEQIKAPSIHNHCFIKKNNEQFLTFFLQQVREHVSSKQLNMNAPRKKKKHTWFLITQSFKGNRKEYISVIQGFKLWLKVYWVFPIGQWPVELYVYAFPNISIHIL